MGENSYHLQIISTKDDTILVDAHCISLVCAYNIIKLYGNRVVLRLEVNDGKELQP